MQSVELDPRKQLLLRNIVLSYVERAEPVGSHYLANLEGLGVRSATIRNELAEMTELGMLRQPHTSAGRIPSDRGYRYYVDRLMDPAPLHPAERALLREAQRLAEGDLEQLLVQTCRVLSSLTRYTSVATLPAAEAATLQHIHLAALAPRRLLVVAVLDNGQVIHRQCEPPRSLSAGQVTRLGNALDLLLRGWPVGSLTEAPALPDELADCEDACRAVLAALQRGAASEEGELLLEGASNFLDQPEFRDANRIEPLIRFLEARRDAFETLRRVLAHDRVAVSIGEENPHEAMHGVSIVSARYAAGGAGIGWVAVLGPTRMHYPRAATAVCYAATLLSEALTGLGGE